MNPKRMILIVSAWVACTFAMAQEERSSSSLFLQTSTMANTTVPFYLQDPGKQLPIRWGLDVAWINDQNIRKGINHIGKENISLVRGCFRTKNALTNDSVLTSDHTTYLQRRINLARLVSDTVQLILNEDQEAGINTWYGTKGKSDTKHWAAMIDAHVKWIQEKYPKMRVVAISPFNEPDYSSWGQGSQADMKEIARLLKEEYPRFSDIAITAGNTLNCDQALAWYNAVKQYVDWGNTHQLAGSFDTYAAFFQKVRNDGKYAYADELHNVGEAMVGANYGMQAGVWWGFDSRARGEFCHISNHGSRIGYGENRSAWTSASVYRNDETGEVKAFMGSSERQANTSTFMFLSRDREVYYDGHGPVREYNMEMPGGTGYQVGQTNAERVIDIVSGEDVPPSVIQGQYKIMNRASRGVVAVYGTYDNHPNISQMSYTGLAQQKWDIEPVDARIGGDYSFWKIKSPYNNKYMNVLNNATTAATVISYDAGCASNEQWYFVYAGEGFYYIKNRESGLYLELASNSTSNGTNIRQNKLSSTESGRKLQQWRFLPIDAPCELKAPEIPTGLVAKSQQASVALSWNDNTESDLDGYMVLRAEVSKNDWNTIARKVKQAHYVDNTCRQGVEYIYKVRAIDQSDNMSDCSETSVATATGEKGMIANWQFDGDLMDNTDNWFDAIDSSNPTFTESCKSGTKALNVSADHIRLPYQIADMDEMTIAFWVNWQTSGNWQRIFEFCNGADEYMYLTPSNGAVMRFAIKNGGTEQYVDSKSRLSLRTWKHVAVTIGNNKVTLYVDGVEVGSNSNISIKPSDIRPSFNYLGYSMSKLVPAFRGYLDDVRIYNYALSQEEVKSVMEDLTNDIQGVSHDDAPQTYYDLRGIKHVSPQLGVNIVRDAKGVVSKKVFYQK